MAKTQIKRLKAERFRRWLAVEVYGRTDLIPYYGKHPLRKNRHGTKVRPRELRQLKTKGWDRVKKMIDAFRLNHGKNDAG